MTFYLKYRPQHLDELDQVNVRDSLKKIVASKNIPHSFLFSGPKGTGKTSAARILAKVVNCEKLINQVKPCNKCDQCVGISKGQNLDVIELDAASNRGIDDVRSLREAVKLAPARAKKKVYIIDEAHMLTTEASNALLKTLEEPPEHVMFILATTNPEKLIATIRSRSTNLVFKKADISEIVSSLKKVSKSEGIKVQDEALREIAKFSDGSFRDAQNTLERLVAEGRDLEKEDVSLLLFGQKSFNLEIFMSYLAKRDAKNLIKMVEESINGGASVKDLTLMIIEKIRNILLSGYGIGDRENSEFNKDELITLLKLFNQSLSGLSYSVIEQVPLEIAMVEWCEGQGQGGETKTKKDGSKGTIKSWVDPKADVKSATGDKENNSEEKEVKLKKGLVNGGSNGKTDTNGSLDDDVWRQILSKIGPSHASTEALLKAAKPLEFDGTVLKLGVYYKFHKEHLEGKPHRDVLEGVLESYLGNEVRVVCTLTEPPLKKTVSAGEAVNGDSPNEEVLLSEPGGGSDFSDSTLTSGKSEDIISLAEKIFSS